MADINEKLYVLIEDFKLTSEKIEQFLRNHHNYLNTSFILVGGFLFFALSGRPSSPEIETPPRIEYLSLLPVLIAVILGIFLYHYQRVMALQGYKKYLEYRINELVDKDSVTISYTTLGVKYMIKDNFFSAYNGIMYGLLYLGSCAFSYINTTQFKEISVTVHALLLLSLAIGAINMKGMPKKIENKAFNWSDKKVNKLR